MVLEKKRYKTFPTQRTNTLQLGVFRQRVIWCHNFYWSMQNNLIVKINLTKRHLERNSNIMIIINIKKSKGLSPKLERLNNILKHYFKRRINKLISWTFVYWFTAAFFFHVFKMYFKGYFHFQKSNFVKIHIWSFNTQSQKNQVCWIYGLSGIKMSNLIESNLTLNKWTAFFRLKGIWHTCKSVHLLYLDSTFFFK